MHTHITPASGDVASVAMYAPDRAETEEALRGNGWIRKDAGNSASFDLSE